MESLDKNLVIDLIENQKFSHKQTSSILTERFPGVRGLSSWSKKVYIQECQLKNWLK